MTFLHAGLAAAGLAAVSIPILIHLLLRQRRRPIPWAAMRFLLEAYRRQRRKLRLQQIILLAVRCLVIALLALALGRPALERAAALGGGGRDVYVMIDTGLASSARDASGRTALDRMKDAAGRILASLGPGDRAGLVTLGAPSREIVAPASADTPAVRAALEDLRPTDGATSLPAALERLLTRLDAEGAGSGRRATVVVLSEFREGSLDLSRPAPALDEYRGGEVEVLTLAPADVSLDNVQVVGVEPSRRLIVTGEGDRAGEGLARITLRRTGDALEGGRVTTVRLRVWGESAGLGPVVAQENVSWKAGERETRASLRFDVERVSSSVGTGIGDTASAVALVAEIDRDPVVADNTWRRPVRVVDAMDVGIVHRRRFGSEGGAAALAAADWARIALTPTATVPVETRDLEPDALDLPVLRSLDALILAEPHLIDARGWERVRGFAGAGGLVVVWPGEDQTVHLWTDAFVAAMGLEWEIAREPTEHAGEGGARIATRDAPDGLLGLLAAELGELAAPVAIDRSLPPTSLDRDARVLLRLDDGTPWLVATNVAGRGAVVYLASAPTLGWTDLPARPLMVPLMHEILRQGLGEGLGALVGVVGGGLRAPAAAARLVAVESDWTAPAGALAGGPPTAGLLRAVDDDGRSVGLVALNADERGGVLRAQDRGALESWFTGLSLGGGGSAWSGWLDADDPAAVLAEARSGSPISVPLLLAALALALLETGLARWFSHAVRAPGAGPASPAGAPA
jgi:hypothetical protein